jgi:AcrR family transcriptional regulator
VTLNPQRRRRGADLENAILEAAWAQLTDAGFNGFTIESVAERAGTSRTVLYRRWADRDDLVGAAIAHELGRSGIVAPDTGTLRGDVLGLLRLSNERNSRLVPLLSVLVGSYYTATGTSFADIRMRAFGHRTRTAMDDIFDRAIARGEVDPARLTPRVRTVAFDLFRHDLLMTMAPVDEKNLESIVDEVFLPLVLRSAPAEATARSMTDLAGRSESESQSASDTARGSAAITVS